MNILKLKVSGGFVFAVIVVLLVFLGPNFISYIDLARGVVEEEAELRKFNRPLEDRKRLVDISLKELPVRDEALLACIKRQANEFGNIHPMSSGGIDSVKELPFLDCAFLGIRDLGGIEGLVGLKSFDLAGNKITNISPLQRLSRLEYLNLGENHINDITVLKEMSNLKIVTLPIMENVFCADVMSIVEHSGFKVMAPVSKTGCKGSVLPKPGVYFHNSNKGELSRKEEIELLEYKINRMKDSYNYKYEKPEQEQ